MLSCLEEQTWSSFFFFFFNFLGYFCQSKTREGPTIDYCFWDTGIVISALCKCLMSLFIPSKGKLSLAWVIVYSTVFHFVLVHSALAKSNHEMDHQSISICLYLQLWQLIHLIISYSNVYCYSLLLLCILFHLNCLKNGLHNVFCFSCLWDIFIRN